jgi:hypothetical protein
LALADPTPAPADVVIPSTAASKLAMTFVITSKLGSGRIPVKLAGSSHSARSLA